MISVLRITPVKSVSDFQGRVQYDKKDSAGIGHGVIHGDVGDFAVNRIRCQHLVDGHAVRKCDDRKCGPDRNIPG